MKKAINILWGESVIAEKYADGRLDEPTELAWAFSVIVGRPGEAVAILKELCRSGSYYGLLGLYVLDPQAYEAEKSKFTGDGKVTLLRGHTFEVMTGAEFLSNFVEKDGERLFRNLVFETIPQWQDTVKLRSLPSDWLREDEH